MTESDHRLPTALWLEAYLRRLSAEGASYYIVRKGAYAAGTVLIKTGTPQTGWRLKIQQRDLDGVLGWADVFAEEIVNEIKADAYISRAVTRDPDLWVVEIESKNNALP